MRQKELLRILLFKSKISTPPDDFVKMKSKPTRDIHFQDHIPYLFNCTHLYILAELCSARHQEEGLVPLIYGTNSISFSF